MNPKIGRDAGFTGLGIVIMTVLQHYGLDAISAGGIASIAVALAARLYRLLRAKWAWLAEFDPPTPALP